ncbi:MAG TPA: 3-deoxy-manno-octulosonate cytidylyltransferase [Dongiaceae bacterium]|nr:3-deoxy-manno-octulosonate cytidylyltransferase [Dongiaceae bacterium]
MGDWFGRAWTAGIAGKGGWAMDTPRVVIVIPARYGSVRLPGKPLVSLGGKPMVERVYERAKQARTASRVIVATDDERIVKAVEGFGGEARMTRTDHRTGTERIAEVAAHTEGDVFVNVQGDEPLLDPTAVDTAVGALLEEPAAAIATVAVPVRTPSDIMDPNVVKTVLDFEDNALYFSRAPIPWVRDSAAKVHARHLKHLGLYVFQRDALLEYPTLPQGELERLEQLEQLRWMENGWKIRVAEVEHDAVSVDVPEDVERVEKLLRSQD